MAAKQTYFVGSGFPRTSKRNDLAINTSNNTVNYRGPNGWISVGGSGANGSPANTGDITFDGVKIRGAGSGSGDGYNNGTIELVPDIDLYNNGQSLIIDPTAPNHIHIRAGGTQDDSNADLIIGGEKTNLIVSDNSGSVKIHSKESQQTVSYLNINENSNSGLITTEEVSGSLSGWTVEVDGISHQIDSVYYDNPVAGQTTIYAPTAIFTPNETYTIYSPQDIYEWTFNTNGYLNGPAMGRLLVSGIVNGESDLWLSSNNSVVISGSPMGGGEFLNNSSNPNNQIATIGDLPIGATGSFTTASHSVTVTNGIITDITAL